MHCHFLPMQNHFLLMQNRFSSMQTRRIKRRGAIQPTAGWPLFVLCVEHILFLNSGPEFHNAGQLSRMAPTTRSIWDRVNEVAEGR